MTVAETLHSGATAASDKARHALETARDGAGKALETARDGTERAVETVRDSTGKAVEAVREGAGKAIDTTSHAAQDLGERAAAAIEKSPLGVLVGGLAIGMLTGSLLPRTSGEARLLAPVGRRLTDTAKGAVDAAKDTARSEFDGLGLSRNAAKDQVGKLLGGVINALAAAGTAAMTANAAQAEASKSEAAKSDATKSGQGSTPSGNTSATSTQPKPQGDAKSGTSTN